MEALFEIREIVAIRTARAPRETLRTNHSRPKLDELVFAVGLNQIVDESVGLQIGQSGSVRRKAPETWCAQFGEREETPLLRNPFERSSLATG